MIRQQLALTTIGIVINKRRNQQNELEKTKKRILLNKLLTINAFFVGLSGGTGGGHGGGLNPGGGGLNPGGPNKGNYGPSSPPTGSLPPFYESLKNGLPGQYLGNG